MNVRAKKFFSYYRPYWKLFLADMICAIAVSFITLAIPLLIRYLIKNLLESDTPDVLTQIYWIFALMVGLVACLTACHFFVDYKGHMMGALMERDIRRNLFEHLQKLSFNFYDEHRTGQLMTRVSNDSFDLAELYHHGPEDILISSLNFIGAFIILLSINAKLALITFIFVPAMAFYGFYFSKKMHAALRKSRDRIGDINAQVEDTLSGIRVVKSFTNEKVEKEKFEKENQKFVESRKEAYKSEAFFYNGLIAFTQLMTVTVVFFGAVSIVKGALDLADLLTFLLYIGILIEPIQRLGNFTRLYHEGFTGFERIMEILEIEPDIKDQEGAEDLQKAEGSIDFQNVGFQYKEGYNHVLKDLNLSIKKGEYLALVGPSGVGKTTLCSLIPRFYEVSKGKILIDGKDIRQVTLSSLRKNIGIVPQEVYLFAGTVSDNIRYGNPEAAPDEIISAAKNANAHEFIMALPKGYDTDIGQRGVKLSGGQKQRLSIARCFLKNPPILILDEATSALDNESEKAIQDSLEVLTAHRTTVVIAHRLTTVRHAKRILFLSDKGIEEEGSHEELIAKNGLYANLYKMQLRI
ncbi:ABC transporter ATP-binding protein [Criblamydia sequanensis]|uniref:Lipid A export ATP-binding/permease protein MsbA n=1 Tax=Candidatus Criblamydia sequanensis CRIB-18 TaxID=1437425 RepID=A0A090CY37_9BACT|nr:ABC transporter ATP-binding protein [Criblamydia sequanensis]CDR33242.1 Putative lipid A export ATP-binding/permease protein MsbA [Criblamydia sequanensis CRIB-18]